eukprot:m.361727 g.361727  ORF g.361727 m.361727 type:complete len:834 (+) comp19959_c0_seq7:4802-7303(+)
MSGSWCVPWSKQMLVRCGGWRSSCNSTSTLVARHPAGDHPASCFSGLPAWMVAVLSSRVLRVPVRRLLVAAGALPGHAWLRWCVWAARATRCSRVPSSSCHRPHQPCRVLPRHRALVSRKRRRHAVPTSSDCKSSVKATPLSRQLPGHAPCKQQQQRQQRQLIDLEVEMEVREQSSNSDVRRQRQSKAAARKLATGRRPTSGVAQDQAMASAANEGNGNHLIRGTKAASREQRYHSRQRKREWREQAEQDVEWMEDIELVKAIEASQVSDLGASASRNKRRRSPAALNRLNPGADGDSNLNADANTDTGAVAPVQNLVNSSHGHVHPESAREIRVLVVGHSSTVAPQDLAAALLGLDQQEAHTASAAAAAAHSCPGVVLSTLDGTLSSSVFRQLSQGVRTVAAPDGFPMDVALLWPTPSAAAAQTLSPSPAAQSPAELAQLMGSEAMFATKTSAPVAAVVYVVDGGAGSLGPHDLQCLRVLDCLGVPVAVAVCASKANQTAAETTVQAVLTAPTAVPRDLVQLVLVEEQRPRSYTVPPKFVGGMVMAVARELANAYKSAPPLAGGGAEAGTALLARECNRPSGPAWVDGHVPKDLRQHLLEAARMRLVAQLTDCFAPTNPSLRAVSHRQLLFWAMPRTSPTDGKADGAGHSNKDTAGSGGSDGSDGSGGEPGGSHATSHRNSMYGSRVDDSSSSSSQDHSQDDGRNGAAAEALSPLSKLMSLAVGPLRSLFGMLAGGHGDGSTGAGSKPTSTEAVVTAIAGVTLRNAMVAMATRAVASAVGTGVGVAADRIHRCISQSATSTLSDPNLTMRELQTISDSQAQDAHSRQPIMLS